MPRLGTIMKTWGNKCSIKFPVALKEATSTSFSKGTITHTNSLMWIESKHVCIVNMYMGLYGNLTNYFNFLCVWLSTGHWEENLPCFLTLKLQGKPQIKFMDFQTTTVIIIMTFYTGRKIGFTVHFWRASEGKVKYGFDFTFDARQR